MKFGKKAQSTTQAISDDRIKKSNENWLKRDFKKMVDKRARSQRLKQFAPPPMDYRLTREGDNRSEY